MTLEQVLWELEKIWDEISQLEIKREQLRDEYFKIVWEKYEEDYREWMFEE